MPGIFICYRRSDTAHVAGRLHAALEQDFGEDLVFRDRSDLEGGDPWSDRIESAIVDADVVLVLVGPRWIDELVEREGGPDHVRQEIELALRRARRTMPVLVDQDEPPPSDAVPDDVAGLFERQALRVRDSTFDDDVERLASQLSRHVRRPPLLVLRRRAPLVAGGLVAVLGLVLVVGMWIFLRSGSDSGDAVEPMSGDFNIAVTRFTEPSGDGRQVTARSSGLTATFAERVEQGIGDLGVDDRTEVRLIDDGLVVTGTTEGERSTQAREIAERLNAHVVMYGDLLVDETGTEVAAEFFIVPEVVPEAEELSGPYRLGSAWTPFDIGRRPDERATLVDQLTVIAENAQAFSGGLMAFRRSDYAAAEEIFAMLAVSSSWPDAWGAEIVPLFAGNAAGRLRNLDEAEDWFERSLSIRPGYGRPLVGLAEVRFQRSAGSCTADDVDEQGLAAAGEQFEQAAQAGGRQDRPDVVARALIGASRVDICLHAAGAGGDIGDAEIDLEAVIESDDPLSLEVRAEANATLGLLQLGTGRTESAVDSYRAALGLSDRLSRRGAWSAVLGFALAEIGDDAGSRDAHADAARYYELAIERAPSDALRSELQRALDDVTARASTG